MEAAVRMHIAALPGDLSTLASALRGTLISPGDPAFEEARQIWNLAHQATPMAIVRAANAGDVATAVQFARQNGIEIAVRSGGHSLAGHGTGNGALVIDLRGLRALHIDPEQRIAWAGPGLTAGEFTAAVAEHGLATPFGDTGSVGLGGITLGGGIGWLVR
jgi:FAD/FMN-containing dehydrogenase